MKEIIFVRIADNDEKNANNKLIEMGASGIGFDGMIAEKKDIEKTSLHEPNTEYTSAIELSDGEIIKKLKCC